MNQPRTAVLHYTAPPVVGGVEGVIEAHAHAFIEAGCPFTVIAGRGGLEGLPPQAEFVHIPELDSRHPEILEVFETLREEARVPETFAPLADRIYERLTPLLSDFDTVIIHNVLTKEYNLPLTQALFCLLDEGRIPNPIAWSHDFAWTSPTHTEKVHPGYPWDLLRTFREDLTYVVVSEARQRELAGLFDRPPEEIHVVYNGVDPRRLLGLTEEGHALVRRLDLFAADLVLLMPVRVTHAKNIELALRVVAALRERVERPLLILTGPPDPHDDASMDYFHELQALRRELGVEHEMRFVYESGPDPDEPYTIDLDVVGDLYRVSDVMFMPSHREGFGMPVLEAGLTGLVVVATDVPAAVEIGGADVTLFDAAAPPEEIAAAILDRTKENPIQRLQRRVRHRYTWSAIFHRDIKPLLGRGKET